LAREAEFLLGPRLTVSARGTLAAVLEHYDQHFKLQLTDPEKVDLMEYLKSL
jgi:hypothetical protein